MDQPISTISEAVQQRKVGARQRLENGHGDGCVGIPLEDFSCVKANDVIVVRNGHVTHDKKIVRSFELRGRLEEKLKTSRRLKGQLLAVVCCVFVTIILSLVKVRQDIIYLNKSDIFDVLQDMQSCQNG